MSLITQCDYCGETIEHDDLSATINVRGQVPSGGRLDWEWDVGYVGHYHTESREIEEPSCYRHVRAAIELAHSWGPTLESIETVSAQSIAHRRRRHTKPEDA